jgi:hypothetical protein
VRARAVDVTAQPKWKWSSLDQVTPQILDQHFTPPSGTPTAILFSPPSSSAFFVIMFHVSIIGEKEFIVDGYHNFVAPSRVHWGSWDVWTREPTGW